MHKDIRRTSGGANGQAPIRSKMLASFGDIIINVKQILLWWPAACVHYSDTDLGRWKCWCVLVCVPRYLVLLYPLPVFIYLTRLCAVRWSIVRRQCAEGSIRRPVRAPAVRGRLCLRSASICPRLWLDLDCQLSPSSPRHL